MHEEKIALVDGQVKAVQQAVAARAVENVYFVACGGSLATLYPGKYILERETAAVSTGAYTAADVLNDSPRAPGRKEPGGAQFPKRRHAGDRRGGTAGHRARRADGGVHHHARFGSGAGGGPYRLLLRRPASPYPAVLTIFPEVYKLTYALLDVWNGTGRLPEVNAAMLRLQDTFDEACAAYRPAARAFGAKYAGEPILYSIAAGLDACVGYVLTNCLVMESLWKHSSPLHAGEFFHGAFEAVDDTAAVFALLGLGKTRALEERAVKFLQRKTGKLTVLDAAALDLEAYPGWLRAPVSALVLNRLAALYCDEMSYAMGHPISSRRYVGWKNTDEAAWHRRQRAGRLPLAAGAVPAGQQRQCARAGPPLRRKHSSLYRRAGR